MPPGIHLAAIEDMVRRFGTGSPERDVEGRELLEFVEWARRAGVRRLMVDGSLVTAIAEPNDVDLVILPGPDYPRDQPSATADEELLWPFLRILVAADDDDVNRWILQDFGIDRNLRPKGGVEVIL